jgi:hypothetical protein
VIPGTTITVTITAHNGFLPQTSQGQLLSATVSVLASGCSQLDQKQVYFFVPPTPLVAE